MDKLRKAKRDPRQLKLPFGAGEKTARPLVEESIGTIANEMPKPPSVKDIPLLQKAIEKFHLYYIDHEHAKVLLKRLNADLTDPTLFDLRNIAFIETLREKDAEVKRNPFADHRNPLGFRASYIARLAKLEAEAKKVK